MVNDRGMGTVGRGTPTATFSKTVTHLGREVLHDRGRVHRRGGTHALLGVHAGLQEAVDTADGELQAGARGPRLRGTLRAALATLAGTALKDHVTDARSP